MSARCSTDAVSAVALPWMLDADMKGSRPEVSIHLNRRSARVATPSLKSRVTWPSGVLCTCESDMQSEEIDSCRAVQSCEENEERCYCSTCIYIYTEIIWGVKGMLILYLA